VVKKGIEITGLIQVSYHLDNEKTKSREIRSLLHGCKDLRCDHLIVITGDYENEETVEWFGLKGKVRFIPLWKWLLNPDFS
jgi:predicted AAA+ superfamily ATPase